MKAFLDFAGENKRTVTFWIGAALIFIGLTWGLGLWAAVVGAGATLVYCGAAGNMAVITDLFHIFPETKPATLNEAKTDGTVQQQPQANTVNASASGSANTPG